MTFLILILALALLLAVIGATLAVVRHDGRGPTTPPRSHHDDRRLPWATA